MTNSTSTDAPDNFVVAICAQAQSASNPSGL
jgi:hypothetical protein